MNKQLIPNHKVKVPSEPLKQAFSNQERFQKSLQKGKFSKTKSTPAGTTIIDDSTLDYLNLMLSCIIQESCEARDWLPWKPWKKYEHKFLLADERVEFLNELVDILCFLINAALKVDCSHKEFVQLLFNKQRENVCRQENKPIIPGTVELHTPIYDKFMLENYKSRSYKIRQIFSTKKRIIKKGVKRGKSNHKS